MIKTIYFICRIFNMLSIDFSIKTDPYKLFLVYKLLQILQITTVGLIHIYCSDDKTFNSHITIEFSYN